MKLNDLLAGLKGIKVIGDADIDISQVAYDSRTAGPKSIFVAVRGFKTDGAMYADQAIENGAVAVVLENDTQLGQNITKIIVPNARIALAEISAAFYGHPARNLKMIGITGTNGKTTISYLVEAILQRSGYKVGVIGTVEARIDGKSIPTKLTTPESPELQELLSKMLKEGVTHVVMEVSSHSLELYRTHSCEFDIAIYTNLTHDHLDFHGNMQNYFKTKLKLFERLGKGFKKDVTAIINVDDPYGKKVMTYVDGNILTYGAINNANLDVSGIETTIDTMKFQIESSDSKLNITTNLIGAYNAYNIMAALLCGKACGITFEKSKEAIESLDHIPGRFERVKAGQKFPVVVDYAHSPDSLTKLLETVRPLGKGKVILVFGCPGERDRAKRSIMGDIAVKLADFSFITTDDPHGEEPNDILDEIEIGVVRAGGKSGSNYKRIEDRRAAIKEAIKMASKDDIVVIAGRGHETFQDYAGKKVPIDDREVAKEALIK